MNWEPVKKLVTDLGGRQVPDTVVFGKDALIARVGKDAVLAAEAWAKFGGQRRQRRAAWDGYMYPVGEAWVYASPHPSDVRRAGFESWPLVEAVIRWALGAHSPSRPGVTAFAVTGLPSTPPAILALDTEGVGTIERVSLAGESEGLTWAATFPFDGPGRDATQQFIEQADTVLIHNALHDVPLLEQAGVEIDIRKVADTMVAHTMLNPWRERGLGKAAPLYMPTEPWKGIDDLEWYSIMDAWALVAMWAEMSAQLRERRMEDMFWREMDLLWKLPPGCKPSWHGNNHTVSKAAGLLEG